MTIGEQKYFLIQKSEDIIFLDSFDKFNMIELENSSLLDSSLLFQYLYCSLLVLTLL